MKEMVSRKSARKSCPASRLARWRANSPFSTPPLTQTQYPLRHPLCVTTETQIIVERLAASRRRQLTCFGREHPHLPLRLQRITLRHTGISPPAKSSPNAAPASPVCSSPPCARRAPINLLQSGNGPVPDAFPLHIPPADRHRSAVDQSRPEPPIRITATAKSRGLGKNS